MTVVNGNVSDLLSRPAIGASIRFVLVHDVDGQPIPLPAVNNGRIYGTADGVVHVDDGGDFTVTLDANEEIDYPPGTYYQAHILTPTTWDSLARTRANRVERQIDFVVPTAGPVDLSDTALWVVSPAPPTWAPLQGPPGEDGVDGEDALYETLPQTTTRLPQDSTRAWCVPGRGLWQPSAGPFSQALVANVKYYEDFEVYDDLVVDAMSVNVRTAVAGGSMSFAIYTADENWWPVALVAASAIFPTTTTPSHKVHNLSLTLPGGRYVFGLQANVAVAPQHYFGTQARGIRFDAGSLGFSTIEATYELAAFGDGSWPTTPVLPANEVKTNNQGDLRRVFLRPAA